MLDSLKHNKMDRLVIHKSPVLEILERYELRDMIHTYQVGGSSNESELTTHFVLYRFGLTFTHHSGAEPGILECGELAGYRLQHEQHLPGILRGLHQYLVLESGAGKEFKVIIPFVESQKVHKMMWRLSCSRRKLSA